MKILLFGLGQLSQQIQVDFTSYKLIVIDRDDCDVTQAEQVKSVFAKHDADLVINATAYTAVDKAEEAKEKAFAVNAKAVGCLAQQCAQHNLPLIHISTDYVFDGLSSQPYAEESSVNPQSVYGQSKLRGEELIQESMKKHLIIRTSWLYGSYGNNFVKNIIRAGQNRPELKIVDDQVGSPTSTSSLSQCLMSFCEMIDHGFDQWGIYHFSGEGQCSWYEFTQEIFANLNAKEFNVPHISPIKTHVLNLLAPRPAYSVLDKNKIKILGIEVPSWQDDLRKVMPVIARGFL